MKIFTLGNKKSLFNIINNYSDVCKELKIEELTIKDFQFLPKGQRVKALAYHQIQNIEKLFNEGWVINWSDNSQQKWYPFYTLSGGGELVFRYSGYYGYCFFGQVGFYKNRETSDFVGKTFIDIYSKLK